MPDGPPRAPDPLRPEPFVERRAPHIPELLDRSPDAVMLLDAQARVLDANEEACRSLGLSREELLGREPRDFVEGLEGPALAEVMGLLRERGVATFRAVHRRKDGTRFPVETRLALLRRGGPPLVVAFTRDVSEREEASRALRESEARYERLVGLLPDGVVAYRDGRIAFANPAALRLVGAARAEDLLGRRVLDLVHPDSRPAVVERSRRVAAGEAAPLIAETLLRLDGAPLLAEVAAAPLGPGEAVVVVRDVGERRAAEAERASLAERLRQAEKLEALGTLAGGVAHDFNNVLAAILGHADALAAELPPGSPGREDAEQIASAALRAKGVVHQILAFARRRPPEARPVDAVATIREELPLVRAALPADVELALRLDPAAGAVRADPTQLHQILLNLAANARDAMQDRGGRLDVEVGRAEAPGPGIPAGLPPGSYARIAVKDTGTGMDAATRARAFEPYFTTKPVGAGSGLGLSVVHGIAISLGGAVALESEPGRGTAVTVWLPRLADGALPERPAAPAARAGRGRVLLVDDDPPVARAVARMLESLGYEVTTCGDGAAALERFRVDPGRFDAVLTDQTLPGLRGDQLTAALLAARPDLPVVICTGYSEQVDEERARALGARALLLKPLDRSQLGEALRAALAPRRP